MYAAYFEIAGANWRNSIPASCDEVAPLEAAANILGERGEVVDLAFPRPLPPPPPTLPTDRLYCHPPLRPH